MEKNIIKIQRLFRKKRVNKYLNNIKKLDMLHNIKYKTLDEYKIFLRELTTKNTINKFNISRIGGSS